MVVFTRQYYSFHSLNHSKCQFLFYWPSTPGLHPTPATPVHARAPVVLGQSTADLASLSTTTAHMRPKHVKDDDEDKADLKAKVRCSRVSLFVVFLAMEHVAILSIDFDQQIKRLLSGSAC